MKPLEWQSFWGRRFRGRITNELITYSMIQFLLWPLQCQCRDTGKWRPTKNGHERELVKEKRITKPVLCVGGKEWVMTWASASCRGSGAHDAPLKNYVRAFWSLGTNSPAGFERTNKWARRNGRCWEMEGDRLRSLSSAKPATLNQRVKVFFIGGLGWCNVVIGVLVCRQGACLISEFGGLGIFDQDSLW